MFQWPLDKLALINRALQACCDNEVAAAEDGSEEWNCASPSYETAIASLMEKHPWSWTRTMATLQPANNVPADTQWDTAYNLPADLVHLIYARIQDRPCVYALMQGPATSGNRMQLCLNAQGGPPPPIPPQTPQPVTIAYISSDTSDIQFATPMLAEALVYITRAGIYGGLHEDPDTELKYLAIGEKKLAEAMARHDQQLPKRALYNSRMTASRRIRRPWPPVPGGWFNTGIPG